MWRVDKVTLDRKWPYMSLCVQVPVFGRGPHWSGDCDDDSVYGQKVCGPCSGGPLCGVPNQAPQSWQCVHAPHSGNVGGSVWSCVVLTCSNLLTRLLAPILTTVYIVESDGGMQECLFWRNSIPAHHSVLVLFVKSSRWSVTYSPTIFSIVSILYLL